ncbi:Carbon dioxide-concentrating mechanism protein CcmK [Sinobacterium norvegicum]|uniref:Carbon dioxide-concentrating mechanism protein CcmK n=1 Tax=Sinobacterium norvegicum TaxID=1641715 RepID=A0ABM9AB27_9GAMM|nr:BMC domain-containing protein [Sinobacterium norvegicum]CAH0990431.1 Carbon dioxide-concentrating mechanism protein CcmK [Sinobacterium norvegicum]
MDNSLGILEVNNLTCAINASDAMVKAAMVRLIDKRLIGSAYVTVLIEGDLASVIAAVDAGTALANEQQALICSHVIARPMDDIDLILHPETVQAKKTTGGRRKNSKVKK